MSLGPDDLNIDGRVDALHVAGLLSEGAGEVIRDLIESVRDAEMAAGVAESQVTLLRAQHADYPAMAKRVADLSARWYRWMPAIEAAKVMVVKLRKLEAEWTELVKRGDEAGAPVSDDQRLAVRARLDNELHAITGIVARAVEIALADEGASTGAPVTA